MFNKLVQPQCHLSERYVLELVPVIQSNENSDLNQILLSTSTVTHSNQSTLQVYVSSVPNQAETSVKYTGIPPDVIELALQNLESTETVSLCDK